MISHKVSTIKWIVFTGIFFAMSSAFGMVPVGSVPKMSELTPQTLKKNPNYYQRRAETKAHQCPEAGCSRSFNWEQSLTRHIRNKHQGSEFYVPRKMIRQPKRKKVQSAVPMVNHDSEHHHAVGNVINTPGVALLLPLVPAPLPSLDELLPPLPPLPPLPLPPLPLPALPLPPLPLAVAAQELENDEKHPLFVLLKDLARKEEVTYADARDLKDLLQFGYLPLYTGAEGLDGYELIRKYALNPERVKRLFQILDQSLLDYPVQWKVYGYDDFVKDIIAAVIKMLYEQKSKPLLAAIGYCLDNFEKIDWAHWFDPAAQRVYPGIELHGKPLLCAIITLKKKWKHASPQVNKAFNTMYGTIEAFYAKQIIELELESQSW